MNYRYAAYQIIDTLVDHSNIILYDVFSTKWSDFTFPNGYTNYTIKKDETQKPYLIRYRNYKTMDYWDVLLLINGITDVFDLKAGDIIKLPKEGDIENFIKGLL